jgi:hypothetical protein
MRTLTWLTILERAMQYMLSRSVRERGAAGHANMCCAALAGGPVLATRADGEPRWRAL